MTVLNRLGGLFLVAGALVLVGACSADETEPGVGAEAFFDAWVAAWSSGDAYETARFYESDVSVPVAQTDLELRQPAAWMDATTHGEGRAWLANWLEPQVPADRTIDDLFLGSDRAVATITIDEISTAAWVEMTVDGSAITEQTTLRWRNAHHAGGVPDPRLEWVDELISTYLAAWSTADAPLLESLYAEDSVVHLPTEEPIVGLPQIIDFAPAALPGAEIAPISPSERNDPAVFVIPSSDTSTVAFVAETDADECSGPVAISLRLDENRMVTTDHRLLPLATIRTCFPERLDAQAWWTNLPIPPRLEEQVTGEVARADGSMITIVNGTAEMERLLGWGLARFPLASLEEPQVESVTFAPVPACEGAAGAVFETDGGGPDLVLCTDPYNACVPDLASCNGFRLSARFGLLHELAHVWILDNVNETVARTFMDAVGTSEWWAADLPWHQRGVEQAAEMLAWGLLDERVTLVRLGSPPCDDVDSGFQLLTGRKPLVSCGD